MLRQTNDYAFARWFDRFSETLRGDRASAAKVWQGAIDSVPDDFDNWWRARVLTRASCFPIHVDDARRVWVAARNAHSGTD